MAVFKKAVFYMRASTDPKKQRNSIAVQRQILCAFAETHGFSVQDEYVDYASGAKDYRPSFDEALSYCVRNNCHLITYRVDRLSRSLSMFARIQSHLHLLRFCELGNTEPNIMVLSVLLGVAHQERVNTSVRVRATYKKMKNEDPDLRWGNPRMMETAHPIGLKVRKENALSFNTRIQGICADLRVAGYCTLDALALQLNHIGLSTRRGNSFNKTNLHRILNYGS